MSVDLFSDLFVDRMVPHRGEFYSCFVQMFLLTNNSNIQMTAPGSIDAHGASHPSEEAAKNLWFEIPARQAEGTGSPYIGGTNRDMGTLALFLVANWYVNGETVLIDGGVSAQ